MRRGLVDVRGRVREAEFDEFKKNFPQQGSIQWFISTAFVIFNELVREHPDRKVEIREAIDKMLEMSAAISKLERAS